MVVRVRLVVEGEVQKVGYRDLVQRVARSLGVKGFVENLRDGNVQIVCEADNEALDNFVEKINVKEDLIDVESVRIVETSPAKGEFEYFDIKYGPLDEELGDRMVMAVNFAKATKKEIGEMRKDVKDVHTGIKDMHSDIKVMGTDIKEMGTDIKEMKTDMKEMKTDIKEMKTNIKEMGTDIKEMKTDIKEMRTDIKETGTETKEMHADIKEMRTDVKQVISGIEGVHSEIHEMRTDMNRSFDEMAKRYDVISTTLNEAVNTMKVELLKSREEVTRAVDNLSRLVQEFVEERHRAG